MSARLSIHSATIGDLEISTNLSKPNEDVGLDFNMEAASGKFCKANVRLMVSHKFQVLSRLELKDQIEIALSSDGQRFQIPFTGIITDIEINYTEGQKTEVKIEAISPFAQLQHVFLNQESVLGCNGFRELLKRIMQLGDIKGEMRVDDDVDDNLTLGAINDYPALSLLKDIFLQKDLVFANDRGYVFRISNRQTFLNEKLSNVKTISNIKSMTIRKTTK